MPLPWAKNHPAETGFVNAFSVVVPTISLLEAIPVASVLSHELGTPLNILLLLLSPGVTP